MPSEFLIVAEKVLNKLGRPMRPKEIVAYAIEQQLFSNNISGKTPYQTMKSKLSVNVRRLGERSKFVRTSPGQFFLRGKLADSHQEYITPPVQKPTSRERVLVFPSQWLMECHPFQGVTKNWRTMYKQLLKPSICSYMDRLIAEDDNNHKQILTYIMVTRRGSVLAYKRGSYNRVEEFLRGSHCIGFGGHVQANDVVPLFGSDDMGVRDGAIRELFEELELPRRDRSRLHNGKGLQCVGVLNDDSSVAGQRHLAFLFQYEVSKDSSWQIPKRGEKSITQLRWLNLAASPIRIWDYEYWSQLCLRSYFSRLVETAPDFRILRKASLRPPHMLCVLGNVGSGKSEATRVLREDFGYSEINTGQLLASLIGIPPIPDTPREQFQQVAWKFIQSKQGPAKLAEAVLRNADELASGRVLIDGIRQQATLNKLRELAAHKRIGTVFVHTSPDIGYYFYESRERTGISFVDYLKIRGAEVEKEVAGMIGVADAVIYNWQGKLEYCQTIHSLMEELRIEKEVDE